MVIFHSYVMLVGQVSYKTCHDSHSSTSQVQSFAWNLEDGGSHHDFWQMYQMAMDQYL